MSFWSFFYASGLRITASQWPLQSLETRTTLLKMNIRLCNCENSTCRPIFGIFYILPTAPPCPGTSLIFWSIASTSLQSIMYVFSNMSKPYFLEKLQSRSCVLSFQSPRRILSFPNPWLERCRTDVATAEKFLPIHYLLWWCHQHRLLDRYI